jgi:hypothetical protein
MHKAITRTTTILNMYEIPARVHSLFLDSGKTNLPQIGHPVIGLVDDLHNPTSIDLTSSDVTVISFAGT